MEVVLRFAVAINFLNFLTVGIQRYYGNELKCNCSSTGAQDTKSKIRNAFSNLTALLICSLGDTQLHRETPRSEAADASRHRQCCFWFFNVASWISVPAPVLNWSICNRIRQNPVSVLETDTVWLRLCISVIFSWDIFTPLFPRGFIQLFEEKNKERHLCAPSVHLFLFSFLSLFTICLSLCDVVFILHSATEDFPSSPRVGIHTQTRTLAHCMANLSFQSCAV